MTVSRRTKKVGAVGRFGSRYGIKIRKQILEVELRERAHHLCPTCNEMRVRRAGTGVWLCRHCGAKFAGGAYTPVALRVETVVGPAAETAGDGPGPESGEAQPKKFKKVRKSLREEAEA